MKKLFTLAIVALCALAAPLVALAHAAGDAVKTAAYRAHDALVGYMAQSGLMAFAVVAVKSAGITNATATPKVSNSANVRNGNLRASQGMVAIANGDSIGSTYRLFRVRSSDRMDSLRIYCSAITSAAGDIGLYDKDDVNGGAVVDVDFFASAQSLAAALNGTDVSFEAGAAGGLLANAEKRIWECLGLAADPNKEYDVALTLTAAATAAGTFVLRGSFVTGE